MEKLSLYIFVLIFSLSLPNGYTANQDRETDLLNMEKVLGKMHIAEGEKLVIQGQLLVSEGEAEADQEKITQGQQMLEQGRNIVKRGAMIIHKAQIQERNKREKKGEKDKNIEREQYHNNLEK